MVNVDWDHGRDRSMGGLNKSDEAECSKPDCGGRKLGPCFKYDCPQHYIPNAAVTIATLTARLAAADASQLAMLKQISDLSTAVGVAEGKLHVSELAGVVEGWQRRTEAAEASIATLTAERDASLSLAETARGVALEVAAKVAEEQEKEFLSEQYAVGQPLASFGERFACRSVATAIRALAASGEAHER